MCGCECVCECVCLLFCLPVVAQDEVVLSNSLLIERILYDVFFSLFFVGCGAENHTARCSILNEDNNYLTHDDRGLAEAFSIIDYCLHHTS